MTMRTRVIWNLRVDHSTEPRRHSTLSVKLPVRLAADPAHL